MATFNDIHGVWLWMAVCMVHSTDIGRMGIEMRTPHAHTTSYGTLRNSGLV